MKTSEVLTKARGFIAQGFTKGTFARDVETNPTNALSTVAVCWCAHGAVLRATESDQYMNTNDRPAESRAAELKAIELLSDLVGMDVPEFNDDLNTTQEIALEWFDKAIEKAKAKEAEG